MEDYETVLLVKPEVFIFKIPPRATNRGYRYAVYDFIFEEILFLTPY